MEQNRLMLIEIRLRRCAIFYKRITRHSFGTTNNRCRSLTVTTNGSVSTTNAVFVPKYGRPSIKFLISNVNYI